MTFRPGPGGPPQRPQYPQQPPFGPGGRPNLPQPAPGGGSWPPVDPGTGGRPKKNRKGLWIGLSIGLVVLLGGTVGVLVAVGNRDGNAPAAANQQVPQGLPDRDAQAITAALRQLDPCKLLDVNGARARGVSQAVTFPTGGHACMMAADPAWNPSYTSNISVMVGTDNHFGHRYLEKPVTLAGAKAYELRQDGGDSSLRGCQLDIPVSHSRAISMHLEASLVQDPSYDSCAIVERYGTSVIGKLANPDALSMDTSQRPMAAWDGCAMLTKLLGADAGKYRMHPEGSSDAFSGCRAIDGDQQAQGSPALQAKYGRWMPGPKDKVTQVGGKDVIVTDMGESCFVEWNQGPTGVSNVWFGNLVMEIEGRQGCAAAQQTAAQAMQLVGQAPNDVTAKPQRPLPYGPDDNDTGSLGACVDLANGDVNSGCVPYNGGSGVPKTFEEAAAAARTNKAVQCEAFQDAVRAAFGDTLEPVTWGDHCVFVEPTHTLVLTVDVDGANAPQPYGTGGVYRDRQVRQVGGKQSVTYWSNTKSAYDVYYSPYNDIGRNGNLHIRVEAWPPRGDNSRTLAVPLDPAKAQLAEQVITQVAQKYF